MPVRGRKARHCECWLGRAGSGKTYGCLAAIAAELRRSPRGVPLILLAPEQATANLERRLATWPGLAAGFTRARVMSFEHLAREALAHAGAPRCGRPLSDMGRVILLRRAMERQRDELRVFRSTIGQSGMVERIDAAILEFQRYGWSLAELEAWIERLGAEELANDLLARKLSDLAALWRAYEAMLATGGWDDPARRSERATEAIAQWDALDGARVWVDGFATFTAQETALIEALLERADSVVFAFCADPNGAADPGEKIGPERLFENIEETCRMVRRRLTELGWTVRMTGLPRKNQPTRFSGSPVLEHLEREVLGRMRPLPCSDYVWERDCAGLGSGSGASDGFTSPIELIDAVDRRAEVETVARRIAMYCRRSEDETRPNPVPAMTWRDVAVLTRDLAPYEELVREVFGQFGIPFFLDRPREIAGHPLARLLMSALGVLRAGWSGRSVVHHLKSGLAGLGDRDAIARIENHILATDPEGRRWMESREMSDELLACWKEAAAPLQRLEASLKKADAPSRALWDFLDEVGAGDRVAEWIERARQEGDEESAQLHERAWEQTIEWLEAMESVAAADPRVFEEATHVERRQSDTDENTIDHDHDHDHDIFVRAGKANDYARLDLVSELMESALGATRARLTPPTLNQVTVGSVDRSRTPDVEAVFVMGMNEKVFPRVWLPDAIVGDEDRDRLQQTGRPLGPDTRSRHRQEHFLAVVALTRASRRLIVTRPQIDEEGKAAEPSVYFTLLREAFPRAPLRRVDRSGVGDDPALAIRPEEWALRLADALAQWRQNGWSAPLVAILDAGDPLERTDLTDAQRRTLEIARAALGPPETPRLDPLRAGGALARRNDFTVTALERFGQCPFRYYAQDTLGLCERDQAKLNQMDLGTIRHHLLDQLYRELRDETGLDWGAIDPDRADRLIERHAEQMQSDAQWRGRMKASALSRLIVEDCVRGIKLFVRALQRAGERYGLVQTQSEWRFGRPEDAGVLEIEAVGRNFRIRGIIDRIDEAPVRAAGAVRPCVLVDYKSGRRPIEWGRILGGVDLQLPVYGLALRESASKREPVREPLRVGGLFYWPLASAMFEAEAGESPDAPVVDERWFRQCGPAGIFEEGMARMLDTEVANGESAFAFPFALTAKGELNKRKQNHLPDGALERLLDVVQGMLGLMIGRIANGEIAARPYWSGSSKACDYCPFGAVCRLAEPGVVQARRLAKLKREDALEAIQKMFF